MLVFDDLRDMYADDQDFREPYEADENLVLRDKSSWIEYMIQEGLLFKGNQLCIPKCPMRENLLKEKHNGGLSGHFGQAKTFPLVNSFTIGQRCRLMLRDLLRSVGYVSMLKGEAKYNIVPSIANTRPTMGCS